MKAIQVAAAGSTDQLRIVEAPCPTPGPGEILVKVRFAGVNFADTMLRRDAYFTPAAFPFIPGVEVVGHVAGWGDGVGGWTLGEAVGGVRLDGQGGYAEFALLESVHAARIPGGLGLDRAVAVLNQGLTAQGLIEAAPEIARGASVLVTAAAGGVGGLCLQLARLGGAGRTIAAASSIDKLPGAVDMGAIPISYVDKSWVKAVRYVTQGRGVDVFIDAIGGAVRQAAPRATAVGGRIVFYGSASGESGVTESSLAQIMGKCQSLTGYSVIASITCDPTWLARTLARLFGHVAAGSLLTPLHPPFSMERVGEAHRAIESRASSGKILIEINI